MRDGTGLNFEIDHTTALLLNVHYIVIVPNHHQSRLGDQPQHCPNKIRSNSTTLRRDSAGSGRHKPINYSNTGVGTNQQQPVWPPRFGLTASQSTDALLSSRYLYHNPLLLSSSTLFKDFLLGPDYGHGWLANEGKLSKLGLLLQTAPKHCLFHHPVDSVDFCS